MKKETLILVLVAIFIVGPAVGSLAAFFITKNPSLRPLGISVEKLTAAGQMEDKNLIIAVIDIGKNAKNASQKSEYDEVLTKAFDRHQAEVKVRFRSVPGSSTVSVTYLVGSSRIGPYRMTQAGKGIRTAIDAEKMIVKQRAQVARVKQQRADYANRNRFWKWVME